MCGGSGSLHRGTGLFRGRKIIMKRRPGRFLVVPVLVISVLLSCVQSYATENTQAQQQTAGQQEAQQQAEQQTQPQEAEQSQEQTQQASRTSNRSSRTTETASASASSSSSAEGADQPEGEQEETEEEPVDTNIAASQAGNFNLRFLANTNMRKSPTTDSDVRVVIPYGISIDSEEKVMNNAGEIWYVLSYAGMTGYIREDTAEITDMGVAEGEENAEDAETEGEEEEPEADEESEDGESEEAAAGTSDTLVITPPVQINTSDTSADEQTNTVVPETTTEYKAPAKRFIDGYFIMFLAITVMGGVISFFTIVRLYAEYARYRKYLYSPKKEKKQMRR